MLRKKSVTDGQTDGRTKRQRFALPSGSIMTLIKVADLNFGCATFCALPSFGAVMTFSSHTTFSSHKVSVKGSDIDMCSAMYFLFDHNTKYFRIYLCAHTVVATVQNYVTG